VDLAAESVEVAPTAHYSMGGVEIDFETGKTGVEGLYAVGETTAGIHGANRLGGNSLAETVALGKIVGDRLAEESFADLSALPASQRRLAEEHFAGLDAMIGEGSEDPERLLEELGDLLETHAGILREEEGLSEGLDALADLRERAGDLAGGERTSRSFEYAVDLGFSLTAAEAVLRGARERRESRGAHFRTDFGEERKEWRRNLLYERSIEGMSLETKAPGEPGSAIQEALDAGYELDYHQLE
ncbi:succinate dehydrogenase, partial [Halobacteriales archaeon QH_8_64_26]